jgi:hypothetical protein
MRKTFAILFLLMANCISSQVYCQLSDAQSDQDQIEFKRDTVKSVGANTNFKSKRLNTGLVVGTSFSYSPNNFYGPSYYLAPNISYQLSPKFQIQAGLIYEKSTFYSLYSQEGYSNDILPMTRTFLYSSGSYLLTPNLTVSGTVYKSIDNIPKLTKYQDPYHYNTQGVQLDLHYKVSNSISVGFQLRQQNSTFESQP